MTNSDAAPELADTPAEDPPPIDALDAALDADFDESVEGEGDKGGAQPTTETNPDDAPQSPDSDAPEAEEPTDTDADTPADDAAPDTGTPAAPARWDAKGRELFQQAPAELQDYIQERERVMQGEHTRRQQELAQARLDLHEAKTAPDTELSRLIAAQRARVSQFADVTDQSLMDAVLNNRISPEDAQRLRAAKAQEDAALQEMENAETQREEARLTEFRQREFLELQATAPELATREGITAVNEFLIEQGATPEEMKWLDAKSYRIADMARQFMALQAAKSKSKPAPVKAGKATPSKSSQQGDPRAARMAALRRKNTPQALNELVDMQLDSELDELLG